MSACKKKKNRKRLSRGRIFFFILLTLTFAFFLNLKYSPVYIINNMTEK